MRETVAGFHARTGRDYAPAPWVLQRGRALAHHEPCPTLFRYPGPCGLRDLLQGQGWLAPPEAEVAWFADRTCHAHGPGALHFGTLALLEPLGLSPARGVPEASLGPAPPAVYGTANVRFDPERMLWVPPSRLTAPIPWEGLCSVAQARVWLGDCARERAEVELQLHAYLEELLALARAGAPGPGVSWCRVPAGRRRALLAEYGVEGRWSEHLARAAA